MGGAVCVLDGVRGMSSHDGDGGVRGLDTGGVGVTAKSRKEVRQGMKKTTLVVWCGIGIAATLWWAGSVRVSGMVVAVLVGVFLFLGALSLRWGW